MWHALPGNFVPSSRPHSYICGFIARWLLSSDESTRVNLDNVSDCHKAFLTSTRESRRVSEHRLDDFSYATCLLGLLNNLEVSTL